MRLPTLFLAASATAAAIQNLHLNTLPEGTVPTVHECLDALPPTNKTLRNLWGGRCVSVRIDDDVLRACCRGDNLGKASWTPARLPLDECLELDGRGMKWREKRQIRARSAESFACSECDFRIGLNSDGTQAAEKVHCSCSTPDNPERCNSGIQFC
ncbi:hypothetical protein CMUS01_12964 [Colletotrichum musicola]|uniref:Cyanovirin-N domain-containing protein n=1 Tax=Colletotrichum musicola TaxID=2175873 RepID=A0A8H6JGU9_9PEZI|nr:hypothetical protein CMUS01_12964 [Colletotrichum musicola]